MQLADKEAIIIEAPFGLGVMGGNATLTDRRIVMTARDYEESVPLAAVTSVRAAFARNYASAFWGAVILALALGFALAYRPLETAVNGLGHAIEKRMTDKTPDGAIYGRYVYFPIGVVWLLMAPLIGWGGFKFVTGAIGRTELVIATASGELRSVSPGRKEELMEFGPEVGRQAARA